MIQIVLGSLQQYPMYTLGWLIKELMASNLQ